MTRRRLAAAGLVLAGLVAASALFLGAGRVAVRRSVDLLAVLLVALAVVTGLRSYQYFRAVRNG